MQKARLVRTKLDGAHMPEAILTGAGSTTRPCAEQT